MISFSRLACNRSETGDRVRYASTDPHGCRVVVWNVTQRCNLTCQHCYASCATSSTSELTLAEGRALIDDLAEYGVRVLLLSGGEPLLRDDIFALIDHAAMRGLRPVLSSNGMLITPDIARHLAQAGLGYVGISLDGDRELHNALRAHPQAYDQAVRGIRLCRDAGLKVGLRFTITRSNQHALPKVFDFLEAEAIPRICVYHLAYSGRGRELSAEDQDYTQIRASLSWLLERTRRLHQSGRPVEVLTVDNHVDGPWLILRLLSEGDYQGARRVEDLLRLGGGNASGERIACVSWDGSVHPDQFWRNQLLGSLRERRFSALWSDPENTLLQKLRARELHLPARCKACNFLPLCRGNLRARADYAGDPWGDDPACYLSDVETQTLLPSMRTDSDAVPDSQPQQKNS